MSKRTIVRVKNDGGGSYLVYNDAGWYKPDQCLSMVNPSPSPEEYAALCDQEAENDNYHEVCGAHAGLLTVIRIFVNESNADDIMREIAERGGILGLKE